MKNCAVMFSGGLDSVALAILLKREGLDVDLVYMSHRHGGNVTKKEVVAAGQIADKLGCELAIFKKRPATPGSDAWYTEWGAVGYSKRLPVPKSRKGHRNRIFLKICKDVGIVDNYDFIALGVWPSASSTVPKADVSHEGLVKSAPFLSGGQLVTFGGLGIESKADMIRAVGRRSKKNVGLLYASESCLMYFNTACGECASCHDRVDAFMEAWGQDKTKYRKGTYAARRKRRKSR